jgi:hypothetical protein
VCMCMSMRICMCMCMRMCQPRVALCAGQRPSQALVQPPYASVSACELSRAPRRCTAPTRWCTLACTAPWSGCPAAPWATQVRVRAGGGGGAAPWATQVRVRAGGGGAASGAACAPLSCHRCTVVLWTPLPDSAICVWCVPLRPFSHRHTTPTQTTRAVRRTHTPKQARSPNHAPAAPPPPPAPGLSWSDVLLGPLPNVYLYAANNPSESIVAKRRGYGTIVSHNVPPYGRAGEAALAPRACAVAVSGSGARSARVVLVWHMQRCAGVEGLGVGFAFWFGHMQRCVGTRQGCSPRLCNPDLHPDTTTTPLTPPWGRRLRPVQAADDAA